MKKKHRYARRVALALAAMAFLGVAAEGLLRAAGWGAGRAFFLRQGEPAEWITASRFGWLFFPPPQARVPWPARFPAGKPTGTYRVFVLGESAAMGDPEPAFSVARVLEVLLQEACPDRKVEVINAALVAIDSAVVGRMAEDALAAGADALVVYAGNNEFIGPHSVSSRPVWLWNFDRLVRLQSRIRASRVGQGLALLGARLGARSAWEGPARFAQVRVVPSDPAREETMARFVRQAEAIAAAAAARSVPVVFCTVPSRLSDFPPMASVHPAGWTDADEARWQAARDEADRADTNLPARVAAAWERVVELDPGYAESNYRLGQARLAAGQTEAAIEAFVTARDLDALPIRTTGEFNDALRRFASSTASGVRLVDAERVFREEQALGRSDFLDHVHLTFSGTFRLARLLGAALTGEEATVDPGEAAARLGFSEAEELRLRDTILEGLSQPLFRARPGGAESFEGDVGAADAVATAAGTNYLAEAEAVAKAASERRPEDWALREVLARRRVALGDTEGAWKVYESLLPWGELRADLLVDAGVAAAAAGKPEEALWLFDRATVVEPWSVAALYNRGVLLAEQARPYEAAGALRAALRLRPRRSEELERIGRALLWVGEPDSAARAARRGLAADPTHTGLRGLRGLLALSRGDPEEAAEDLAVALNAQPRDAALHHAMAQVMMSRGSIAKARFALATAVQLDTTEPSYLADLSLHLSEHPVETNDLANALGLAEVACNLTSHRSPGALEALAAAHAASGRPGEALAAAQLARELALFAGDRQHAARLGRRIELLEKGLPATTASQP